MSNTQTYKIISTDAPIRSNPSLFSSILGILKQNTLIEVISINGVWAKFKYKNKDAYILILFLKEVETITTGSITVKYLNVDTNKEIAPPTNHNFLKLKSYSYIAPNLDNYTVIEPNNIIVTLTLSSPNQNIVFYYKENKVYGSVTIKYVDKDTNLSIAESKVYENLELKTYSYNAMDILRYKVFGESTKYVILSKDNPKQTLIFEYSQVLGKVTIKYLDLGTKKEIAESDIYTNLSMGEYTYTAKSIEKYTLVGENIKSISLTYDKIEQLLSFEYKKDSSEYHTITNNLTNCKSSNNSTSINSSSEYTTTITADSGYTIPSITVIMGGTNITSTAVSGNVINIEKVTENIVITAVATSTSSGGNDADYDESGAYVIPLSTYGINNTGANATATTEGINKALVDCKNAGHRKVKLPAGNYLIDVTVKSSSVTLTGTDGSWSGQPGGIAMQSDIDLILTDCTLTMVPTDNPYYSMITMFGCNNSKVINGTLIGDKIEHDYGMRINNNGLELERGTIDESTGQPSLGSTGVRTKNFITQYENWFTKEKTSLPTEFALIPLWNCNANTTGGHAGRGVVYCYDSNNNFLGCCSNKGLEWKTLLSGTAKIKISVTNEDRLDSVWALNTNSIYYNPEFPSGIRLAGSNNVEINGCHISNFCGDSILTSSVPGGATVSNFTVKNCTLESNRRQGISLTANSDGVLIQNCNIGKINGTDPQTGIDIEHYGYVRDVVIDGCNFYDNKTFDIVFYNGNNIELKNSTFNGGIGETYATDIYVHDNTFIYKDNVDKRHKDWGYSPSEVKGYTKIINNYFEGYRVGEDRTGVMSKREEFSDENIFTGNKLVNCLCRLYKNVNGNTYDNCEVIYHTNDKHENEIYINGTTVNGNIVSQPQIPIYTITNNLTNCTNSNKLSTVGSKGSYKTIIMANKDYSVSSINVTMGGVNITSSSVSGNSINIPSVTGNVIITAIATSSSSVDYNVSILENNITIPYGRGDINSYENKTLKINSTNGDRVVFYLHDLPLKDNTDYKLTCSFDQENSNCFQSINSWEVYSEGVGFQQNTGINCDEMSLIFNSRSWSTASNPTVICAIHGKSIVGLGIFNNLILVELSRETKKYTITNNLTNASTNNSTTKIQENESYTATITANSGYTISSLNVTVGGINVTSSTVNKNSINIPSVTGDIVITATAILQSTEDNEDEFVIDIASYGISNNNTNATATTEGINRALADCKNAGRTKVKLPVGTYAIDTNVKNDLTLTDMNDSRYTWTLHRKGISMQSDMELILTDCTLQMIPSDDPYYCMFTIAGCKNTKVIGGTLLGDKYEHDYGMRINNNFNELESGAIDTSTGALISNSETVRTKDFITEYKYSDGTTKSISEIPTQNFNDTEAHFALIPLWNTTYNTTDGGYADVFCYDSNENFLGIADGNWGFAPKRLKDGTHKIKIVIYRETRLDAVLGLNLNNIYYNPEFPALVTLYDSDNIEINNMTMKYGCGDCLQIPAPPVLTRVDNLKLINCTMEDSRRQGISVVGSGENWLLKECRIGKIQGTDPQAGIDVEVEASLPLNNVVIDGCKFYDNKTFDIVFYNGHDFEVKNCKFNGGIGETYAYNINIHDNEFVYEDNVDKKHKGWAYSPSAITGYTKLVNNYFEGYSMGGIGIQSKKTEHSQECSFTGNRLVNCFTRLFGKPNNNIYENCNLNYVDAINLEDETITNTIFKGEGINETTRIFTNCTLNNSVFGGPAKLLTETVFDRCTFNYDNETFCNAWDAGKYTVQNSIINTNYTSLDTPFIRQQGCDATFTRNTMNLSCTQFIWANYKIFTFTNNNVTFNQSYTGNTTTSVFNSGTYDGNRFYKTFNTPKVTLPDSTNSYINDVPFTNAQDV